MKQASAFLFFIMLASVARLEAHAFLQQAEPGVGSTVQASPNEVKIRFTERDRAGLQQDPGLCCSPGRKSTKVMCIWIAPIPHS